MPPAINKDWLTLALIGGGAYVLYKSSKGIGDVAGGIGTGVKTIAESTGQNVSDVLGSVSGLVGNIGENAGNILDLAGAPFDYGQEYMDIQQAGLRETRDEVAEIYDLKAKNKLRNVQESVAIDYFTDEHLREERIARSQEYGQSFGEYLQRMFMPSPDVAEARRSGVTSGLRSAASNIWGSVTSFVPNTISKLSNSLRGSSSSSTPSSSGASSSSRSSSNTGSIKISTPYSSAAKSSMLRSSSTRSTPTTPYSPSSSSSGSPSTQRTQSLRSSPVSRVSATVTKVKSVVSSAVSKAKSAISGFFSKLRR